MGDLHCRLVRSPKARIAAVFSILAEEALESMDAGESNGIMLDSIDVVRVSKKQDKVTRSYRVARDCTAQGPHSSSLLQNLWDAVEYRYRMF